MTAHPNPEGVGGRKVDMETRKKILVVDDEADLVTGVSRLLERAGFEVYSASDGNQALERVRETGWFDLIILDVRMPVLDGYETLSILRDTGYADIPVILLTGGFSPEDVARGHDRGAILYMRKPFAPSCLANAVAYALNAKAGVQAV